MSGDCLSCGEYHRELKKWKLFLFGEWERLWLCQACRSLPRRELTAHVEWMILNMEGLDREPPAWRKLNEPPPAPTRRHLRVVEPHE